MAEPVQLGQLLLMEFRQRLRSRRVRPFRLDFCRSRKALLSFRWSVAALKGSRGTVALGAERRFGETSSMRSRSHPRPRPTRSSAFTGYRFPPKVITLAVRWYLRFGLSYRDGPRAREVAAGMLASMPETINRDMSLRHSCLPPGRPGARAPGIPERPVRPSRHPIHDGHMGR